MPNIASVLRDEITRLSRRASRKELAAIKKASAQHRRNIAALKRDIAQLVRKFSVLSRNVPTTPVAAGNGSGDKPFHFVAKALRSHRERLGASAGELAKLVGVSAQSIYNWERGVTRPREPQLGTLAALRGMNKKELRARMEDLDRAKSAKRPSSASASRSQKRSKGPARRAKK